MSVIDTHQHLWDLSRVELSWHGEEPLLQRDFVSEHYLEATAGLGITKAVYMEVDVVPSHHRAEVEYITEVCRCDDYPTVAAVVSCRPESDDFPDYLASLGTNPYIKGLRRVLHVDETPPGHCLQDPFVRGVRLLGEYGLLFDICIRPQELEHAARLIDLCPDTTFVLDHCGNPDVCGNLSAWKAGVAEVAERENVFCKVSGFVTTVRKGEWTPRDLAPVVDHVFAEFGADRLLFAGDWPVCTLATSYKGWFDALAVVIQSRSEEEKRRLFHDNAARLYGL
jgi:predicted TIM-barrel fold metal-dependent hydrolase